MITVDAQTFTILCVCTGNICRSPAAERLLAVRLGAEVRVGSAGTGALVGQPVSPPMDDLLLSAGADPAGFAAQTLTETLVRRADLVLAMTQAHRGAVVELWPGAVRRTFTLKELARLLETVDPADLAGDFVAERLTAAIPLAAAGRHQVLDSRVDDIVDPYGQSAAIYRQAFDDVHRAVDTITQVIRPEETPTQPPVA